ncbi:MAG: hypothetical protein ACKO5R_10745 [Planctomycetaceae bacterium]
MSAASSPARRRVAAGLFVLAALASLRLSPAVACPFCGTVGESIARKRAGAAAVCIAEAVGPAARDARGLLAVPFRVLHTLQGTLPDGIPATLEARVAAPVAGTAVLFVSRDDPPRYSALAAEETVLGYVMRVPDADVPAAERLAWFAARLEHPDGVIAEDAFAEFAVAPFTDVRAAAAALADRPLGEWLSDPGIDQRRRGFYGLALGIVAAAGLPADAPATSRPLREALATVAGDFRTGADGLMGGILVADGPGGLEWLLGRAGPDRPVDQRQLLSALRFAWEYLGDSIPPEAVVAATARLAGSVAVAADAIVDLARYGAWGEVDAVAAWWDRAADDPLLRRAVAGYLLACPEPAAAMHLARLEREDPAGVAKARAAAALPLGQ